MRKWIKQMSRLFTFNFFMLLCLPLDVQACDSDAQHNYKLIQDRIGRKIVVQRSLKDRALRFSIDQTEPIIISLPEQSCYEFVLEDTPEGDVIALWYAINSNKEIYSLYVSILPAGKSEWLFPICISHENEQIVGKSAKLIAISSDDISVFWESLEFNSSGFRHVLRTIKGSVNSWGTPITHSTLNYSEN